jgi:hypothetical protein
MPVSATIGRFVLLSAMLTCCFPAAAAEVFWRGEYSCLLENREYDGVPERSYTFFLGRLTPGVGLRFDSTHQVALELLLQEEFGSRAVFDQVDVAAYYRAALGPLRFYAGIFPRRETVAFPRALLDDSVAYYRPYLEGGYVSASAPWGSQAVWVDWTGRRDMSVRESFLVGATGHLTRWHVFGDYHFLYYHLAGRHDISDPVHDNYGGRARVGVLFGPQGMVDSVRVGLGVLAAADRVRNEPGWRAPVGFAGTLDFVLRRAGLRVQLYLGEPQELEWGDQLYAVRRYTRTDLFVVPILTDHVRATFGWGVHAVEDQIEHSQTFLLTASLAGSRRLRERTPE